MSYYTIGIDPGAGGGIAIIRGAYVKAHKMPETERDVWDLFQDIKQQVGSITVMAGIEKVHAMPGQGVTSMFNFGKGYGALRMALIAAGIPFRDVTPQTWQKALGCLTKGDKNVSKAMAQQLYPQLKITHATADALLIATWMHRQF